jgi:hypothetical protein
MWGIYSVCTCVYICTYAHMYICTYAHMYICTYVHMHVCTYVCTNVHIRWKPIFYFPIVGLVHRQSETTIFLPKVVQEKQCILWKCAQNKVWITCVNWFAKLSPPGVAATLIVTLEVVCTIGSKGLKRIPSKMFFFVVVWKFQLTT